MAKVDGEDWLNDENENALIDMWQAKPVLYDITCKGYSNRNQHAAAIADIAEVFNTTSKQNRIRVDAVTQCQCQ